MTLTPQEVREKQFTTVKMRTGYDMDEVDTFLDSVESALGALIVDNDDLRAQLASKPAAAVTSGEAEKKLTEAQAKVAEADRKVAEAERKVSESNKALADAQAKLVDADRKLVAVADREKAAEAKLTEARRMATATVAPTATAAAAAMAAPSPGSANTPANAPAVAPIAVVAPADTPVKALAILEAAQRTADETVAAAKGEAESIVAHAREDATRVAGQLDEQRAALETKVNELRSFERSYRTTLRDTISGQLVELDKVGSVEPIPDSSTPSGA